MPPNYVTPQLFFNCQNCSYARPIWNTDYHRGHQIFHRWRRPLKHSTIPLFPDQPQNSKRDKSPHDQPTIEKIRVPPCFNYPHQQPLDYTKELQTPLGPYKTRNENKWSTKSHSLHFKHISEIVLKIKPFFLILSALETFPGIASQQNVSTQRV